MGEGKTLPRKGRRGLEDETKPLSTPRLRWIQCGKSTVGRIRRARTRTEKVARAPFPTAALLFSGSLERGPKGLICT